jgi:hypothetical protein
MNTYDVVGRNEKEEKRKLGGWSFSFGFIIIFLS